MKIVMICLRVFKMCRAFSLLVLVANFVFWASGRLIPLQLVANATLSNSAIPVK